MVEQFALKRRHSFNLYFYIGLNFVLAFLVVKYYILQFWLVGQLAVHI